MTRKSSNAMSTKESKGRKSTIESGNKKRGRKPKEPRSFVLPQTVYRQAYWALRDLGRMKEELARLEDERDLIASGEKILSNFDFGTSFVSDNTGNRAVKIANLSSRILAIEAAFYEIPEKYRLGLWDKNVENIDYPGPTHINTWKKWQQVLIYYVAKNLQLF
jgi:hypothetical protein